MKKLFFLVVFVGSFCLANSPIDDFCGPQAACSFQIVIAANNKCLDVLNGSKSNSVPILQLGCKVVTGQQWQFKKQDDGSYSIISDNSGTCMEIPFASPDGNVPLTQFDCNNQNHQRWDLVSQIGGGCIIKNKSSGLCLTALPGDTDFVSIVQTACDNSVRQKFNFIPVL